MKKTLVFSFFIMMLISSCVSPPEDQDSTLQTEEIPEIEVTDSQDTQVEEQEETEEREILRLELIEPQEPLEIEVVNLRPSQDLDFPPFQELNLNPAMVNEQGWFIENIEGRLHTAKVINDFQYYRFSTDGRCEMTLQQVFYDGSQALYNDTHSYRGTYSYQPYSYQLEINWEEFQPIDGEAEILHERWMDHLIIGEEGIYHIYFTQEDGGWAKTKKIFHGQGESREVEFIELSLEPADERFYFSMVRRLSSPYADPEYQSMRDFDIKGRGEDMIGQVFFLEDQLTYKSEYLYLYHASRGVVPMERQGE